MERLYLIGRIIAGSLGAYALSALVAVTVARLMPGSPSEAVTTGGLVSVLVMPAATLWVFGVERPRLAIGGFALALGAFSLLVWLLGPTA